MSLALPLPGGHGIVWDGEDDAAGAGVRVAPTHRGPTSFSGRQLGAQGGSQRWHLAREHSIRAVGRRLVGFRKQPAVPEGLPRDQLGGPRRCHGVSLPAWPLPRSLRRSPFSNMEQWPSPGGPHQPGAMLRAGRWAAGYLGVVKGGSRAVLSNPSCSPATRLTQFRGQDLLCCYFFGDQARAGCGVGALWPQTVALPLPWFRRLSSRRFPVRSHWKLAPGAGPVLVSQGLSWPGGQDGRSRGS